MKFTWGTVSHRLGLAAALAVGASGVANATLISPNGSFSGGILNYNPTTVSSGTWEVGTGTTSITLSPPTHGSGKLQITGQTDPYLGSPNNLSVDNSGVVSVGDSFTLSTQTFTVATQTLGTPLVVSLDGLTFSYTTETITSQVNGNIGLLFLGDLTGDTNDLYITPTSSAFSATFTQSGPTSSIGVAFSIETPPATTPMPEPMSIAVLGVGLIGLAGTRVYKGRK